ncbi:transporter substrate-binding domain-containing protein [uncultured Tateyamaria sp.]|uniref:transporter substrate-binding domain-containing protein n=1 Tax=uncultured Tateyamaria sp. TaxID=455651 RepID=UPI00260A63F2|nr:transporter substrate-binding domain-containing protein [uncultured Tateyamaria sp.]
MKAVALSAALLCTMAPALHAQEALMVGVRSDATGMAHTSEALVDITFLVFPGPLEEDGFEGYVAFICDSALVEMQTVFGAELSIEVVPLLAAEVFPALRSGEIDIICSPTTATKKRLSNYISSPPVFLSGVTYAQRKPVGEAATCSALVGSLGGSTSGLALLRASSTSTAIRTFTVAISSLLVVSIFSA